MSCELVSSQYYDGAAECGTCKALVFAGVLLAGSCLVDDQVPPEPAKLIPYDMLD